MSDLPQYMVRYIGNYHYILYTDSFFRQPQFLCSVFYGGTYRQISGILDAVNRNSKIRFNRFTGRNRRPFGLWTVDLRQRPQVSASHLADCFHIAVRRIQRDRISISSIGISVYSEGGRCNGGTIKTDQGQLE